LLAAHRDNFEAATTSLVDQLSSTVQTAEARGRSARTRLTCPHDVAAHGSATRHLLGRPRSAEFWRKRFEREKRTRRALEESLQAMAIEHSQLETQGTADARRGNRLPPPRAH